MRQSTAFIFGAFILMILSSCSNKLTPYTERLQDDFEFSTNDLERIQFYLSSDIILQRNLGLEETRITEGKIQFIDGKEVERIVFKKGTPGVLVFSPKSNRLAISFEEGGDDKYLMFGPNKQAGGRFVLLAKEWRNNLGKVSYNGKIYTTTNRSAYSALLVDIDKYRDIDYDSERVKGRKVGT